MQNYKYAKSLTEKFTIKGELDMDGQTINYIDADKEEQSITIDRCFAPFKGQSIDLTITSKSDQDLSDEFEELGEADI